MRPTDRAEGRQQSISADNAIARYIGKTPASMNTSGLDSFTYLPMLGLPAMGLGLYSTYSISAVDQPGFNSIYLLRLPLICQCLRGLGPR